MSTHAINDRGERGLRELLEAVQQATESQNALLGKLTRVIEALGNQQEGVNHAEGNQVMTSLVDIENEEHDGDDTSHAHNEDRSPFPSYNSPEREKQRMLETIYNREKYGPDVDAIKPRVEFYLKDFSKNDDNDHTTTGSRIPQYMIQNSEHEARTACANKDWKYCEYKRVLKH